jgi:hypothetical protein
MKWNGSSVAMVVAAVFSVGIGAQTGGTMAKDDMTGKMDMKDTTYTGCIEAGSAVGTFTLTHVVEDHMGKGMMKDSKNESAMPAEHMEHDAMAPTMLKLTGEAVDLRKHVGHKVTVTGSASHDTMQAMQKDAMNAAAMSFNVKKLKMIAASCS